MSQYSPREGSTLSTHLQTQAHLMDILTHHIGETIMIGEGVAITILGVHGSQVRMGVYTPNEVAVNREAIFERIAREKMHTGTAANQAF